MQAGRRKSSLRLSRPTICLSILPERLPKHSDLLQSAGQRAGRELERLCSPDTTPDNARGRPAATLRSGSRPCDGPARGRQSCWRRARPPPAPPERWGAERRWPAAWRVPQRSPAAPAQPGCSSAAGAGGGPPHGAARPRARGAAPASAPGGACAGCRPGGQHAGAHRGVLPAAAGELRGMTAMSPRLRCPRRAHAKAPPGCGSHPTFCSCPLAPPGVERAAVCSPGAAGRLGRRGQDAAGAAGPHR